MGWLTDGHVAALAYQADVQARLDRDEEMGADECFGGCAHRDACLRAVALMVDDRAARHASIWLECDECTEWKEVAR